MKPNIRHRQTGLLFCGLAEDRYWGLVWDYLQNILDQVKLNLSGDATYVLVMVTNTKKSNPNCYLLLV